jgi:hypothetical protein
MLTESARMSSASEARFRLQAPNSVPREIKVIALDAPSEVLIRRLAKRSWSHATFLTASAFAAAASLDVPDVAPNGWLTDLGGGTRNLMDEVGAADLVVMVAMPGGNAQAAPVIGAACSAMRVNTAAFISGASSASEEAVSKTLAQLRPWSLMVVVAKSEDYIEDMLVALRA